ncbi:acyl carrier protein [Sulfuricaulis limicola]|uniref:Acyl carrier protein n=1 Tax=Sulfuricaulis limicola TaxID=1620215 RepID=A0A1B4XG60_9GAMM|nr:acyl carrier protein [Sulfuricaulis limicola]BAV33783.1 acyl carrier protein [Sulfuricaulis limicola]
MNVNVQQRVFKVFSEVLNRKETEIQPELSLRDDLQLDSLQQMTLFIALEDEFEHSLPPEEVTGLVTVKDIVSFIDRKLQETASA